MKRLLVSLALIPMAMFATPASANHEGCIHAPKTWNGSPAADCAKDYASPGANNTWDSKANSDVMQMMGGADYGYGSDGNDLIVGGAGPDHLYGEAHSDTLYEYSSATGGTDFDYLNGGSGDDYLFCGRGSDICNGGGGFDTLYHCQDGIADPIYNIEKTIPRNPATQC